MDPTEPEPTAQQSGQSTARPGEHGASPSGSKSGQAVAVGPTSGTMAPVRPLDVTGVRTVGVGTLLFLLAGLVLLAFHGWLEDTDREWWLWTCVAGFGLGVFGYDYCRRRARHHEQDPPAGT